MKYKQKQKITQYLMRNGSATYSELSLLCKVSQSTIRRYLSELHDEAGIELTRGGALYPQSIKEVPYQLRIKSDYELNVKRCLAEFAVKKFIHDEMVLCLEGGTTICRITEFISDYKNLTIFTNGVNTISNLYNIHSSSLAICSGGILKSVNNSLVGPVAVDFFENYNADIGFFSSLGISIEKGFTDADLMDIQVNQKMGSICEKIVIITTSDKIAINSATTAFRFKEIDAWITDSNAPEQFIKEVKNLGVDTYIVDVSHLDAKKK